MRKALLLIAAVVALAACTKTVEVPVEVEVEKIIDILTLNAAQVRVPNAAVDQPISFTTEDAWTIASDADWITFDKTSGAAGSNSLTMKVAKNEGYNTRTGRVTLSTTHSGTTKNTVFTVVQSETEVFNTTIACRVDFSEQDIAVDFNSNLTPEVKVVEGDWLTVAQTKGAPVDGKIVVHVAKNEELDSRSGSFTVAAGSSIQTYNVVQASQYAAASSATALFLGNKQFMYDNATYTWNEFAQFAVQFATAEGDVTLALNVDPAIEDVTKIPAGTYNIDETGAFAPGTFSIKSASPEIYYYTSVVSGEKELDIIDGTITISETGGIYSVVAELTDIAGTSHLYSYKGELAATDESFGMRVYSAQERGQYYTYYTTQTYETLLGFQFNKPFPGVERYISYMSFSLYTAAIDANLPTGSFTLAVPEVDATLPYSNGTTVANAGTFYMTSCENRTESWGEASYALKEGSILEIVKQDNGLYTFKFNMTIVRTPAEGDAEDIVLDRTITDVYCGQLVDMGMSPAPDSETVEFVNGGFNAKYSGYYYGDVYGDGGHIIAFGWNTINNSSYELFITFNVGANEFTPTAGKMPKAVQAELGTGPRYSTESIPDGTYTYAEAYNKDALQLLPGYNKTTCRAYLKNLYSGTIFYIVGGSVTFASGTPTFNIDAVSKTGATTHISGSFPTTPNMIDCSYMATSYKQGFSIKPYVVPAE